MVLDTVAVEVLASIDKGKNEERFLSTQPDAFARAKAKKKRRAAAFELTGGGRGEKRRAGTTCCAPTRTTAREGVAVLDCGRG